MFRRAQTSDDTVGLLALAAALLLAPSLRSQATWFDWRVQPASIFGWVYVDDSGISVLTGLQEYPGNVLGVTTSAPVDGQITAPYQFLAYYAEEDAPVLRLGPQLIPLPEPATEPLIIDVAAGTLFGFGVQHFSMTLGYSAEAFFEFTFAPAPHVLPSAADNSDFGAAIANLGDLTGDGIDDLAVGAPGASGAATPGRVVLVSGADGSAILRIAGQATGDGFGTVVASAGDVDGDGLTDVLVGAPASNTGGSSAGWAGVFSSATGAILFSAAGLQAGEAFGFALAGLGDLDGDGRPEIAVGAPFANGSDPDTGRAVVLRTSDGSTMFEFAGPTKLANLGSALAAAGDLSGDGIGDLLVGAPGENFDSSPGSFGVGTVGIYSGSTGSLLHTLKGTVKNGKFGRCLAGSGDLDGDQVPDVLVSGSAVGDTYAYSGATKTALFVVHQAHPQNLAMTADLDGDTLADFVIGSTAAVHETMGRVAVYSGRDARKLATFLGPGPATGFGFALCSAGDVDGDGLDEFAVGAPGASGGHGAVFVHDLFIHWFDLGQGLPGAGGTPRLQGHGLPYAGLPVHLTLTAAAASSPAVLVIGTSLIDAPFKGGVLVPAPDGLVGLSTDASGAFTASSKWAPGLPSGLRLFFQSWIADVGAPAGWSASNGLMVAVP